MNKLNNKKTIFFSLLMLNIVIYCFSPSKAIGKVTPEEYAIKFLSSSSSQYGAHNPDELQWIKTYRIADISYVRFQQVHQGIDVEGAQIVLTIDGKGKVHQISDSTVDPLLLPDPSFCISQEEATHRLLNSNKGIEIKSVRGPIYALLNDNLPKFVRIFTVKVNDKIQGPPMGLQEVYVDCLDGSIVHFRNLLKTALGKVYDPNPVVNPTVLTVELPNLVSTTNLNGSLAVSYACSDSACNNVVQRAVADSDGNFLYDPVEPSITDAFSEVTAYYHVDKINTWYETQLGYTKICGGTRKVAIVVNMDYPNAFSGDVDRDGCNDIVIGQDSSPTGHDFAYDADVIYHEYTHGVDQDIAGFWGIRADELGYDFSSGALDEGYADYYSVAMTGDPVLGDYALAGYTRHADNTKTCPNSLQGESHEDGGIWTGTLWDMRGRIGNHESDVLGLAVLNSLTSRADFNEAGNALITQANLLETQGVLPAGSGNSARDTATARGLLGCRRIVTLRNEDRGQIYLMGTMEWGGWVSQIPGGVQFAVPTTINTTRVILRFTLMSYGSGSFDAYINYDAPVGFTMSGRQPVPTTYAYTLTGSPDGIVWAGYTDPPIQPGTTYYLAFISKFSYTALLSIQAFIIEAVPPEETDEEALEEIIEEEPPIEEIDENSEELNQPDIAHDDAFQEPTVDVINDVSTADGNDVPGLMKEESGCGCAIVK